MPAPLFLALALAVTPGQAAAPPAQPAAQAAAPAVPRAQAYYEFLLARRLESQGDLAGALAALERAATLDPTSAEIQAEMAAYHARQNDATRAVAAARAALALDATNAEAHRILALVYSAWADGVVKPPAGQTPEASLNAAIEHLAAIADTPAVATDLNMQLTLGRLYVRAGQHEKAIPVLENVSSQAPFVAEPLSLLADAYMALGRAEEATQALERAAVANPRLALPLAELYEQQGRWADAAAAYERASESARTGTRAVRLRWVAALLNIPRGQGASRAKELVTELLAGNADDPRALYLLSTAERQLGNLSASEDAARRLITVEPAGTSGLYTLALTLFARQDYRGVVEALTPFSRDLAARAKGHERDAALLLAQLGYAHQQLDQHAEAIRAFEAARTLAPDNTEYALQLGAAYEQAGRHVDAEREFRRILAGDPLHAPTLNYLGYMLADRGERLPEAVELIERALKIEPGNPAYLDSLGWALFKQGRVAEAEGPLSRAAAGAADNGVIHDHYGDVLATLGRTDEATKSWERALEAGGDDLDTAAVQRKIRNARGRKP
ncbi:MAG: tetratricopeptide repeat protein [Acidobacteriota bacterium]